MKHQLEVKYDYQEHKALGEDKIKDVTRQRMATELSRMLMDNIEVEVEYNGDFNVHRAECYAFTKEEFYGLIDAIKQSQNLMENMILDDAVREYFDKLQARLAIKKD